MIQAIYFIISFVYMMVFGGIILQDKSITLLGCFAMFALAIYTFVNGIYIHNNFLTYIFSAVTFGLASYISIRTSIETIGD